MPLPPATPAGLHSLQVRHPRLIGTPPEERAGAESAVVPLLVRPWSVRSRPHQAQPGRSRSPCPVQPPVGRSQRVVLLPQRTAAARGPGRPCVRLHRAAARRGRPAGSRPRHRHGDGRGARHLSGAGPGRWRAERPRPRPGRQLRRTSGRDPVSHAPPAPPVPDSWVQANQEFLTAALAVLAGRLAGQDVADLVRRRDQLLARMPAPPALSGIAEGFGLSGFERDTLLLCAGTELDSAIASACASAHGDPALSVRDVQPGHCGSCRTRTGRRSRPPRRCAAGTWWSRPTRRSPTTSVLRVDERVLHALAGLNYLDPRIECLADPLPVTSPLPSSLQAAADRLALLWSRPGGRRVRLYGRQPPGSAGGGLGGLGGSRPAAGRAACRRPSRRGRGP